MRVLVTGATGFIGRVLVPQLVERSDVEPVLLLRETYDGRPLPPPLNTLRPHYDVVYGDLRNYQLTARAVRRTEPDKVLHLAAAGATEPFLNVNEAVRHNVNGMLNLLRACFEKGSKPQQLVVCRTPGELTAMNTYAASKLAAWDFCRMYARTQEWPIVGAMIFQAYGPGQADHILVPAAMQAALAGKDFPMTSGTQARDWIFVEDVARGLQAIMEATLEPGTTLDLGTGSSTSVADVVREIYDLVGGVGRPLIGALPSRPGEAKVQTADHRHTAEATGWQAAHSLREGLCRLQGFYEAKAASEAE